MFFFHSPPTPLLQCVMLALATEYPQSNSQKYTVVAPEMPYPSEFFALASFGKWHTFSKMVIKILDRLGPKKIIIVSSAPQIRYPDCYGIDMARMGAFIAFQAAISLLIDPKDWLKEFDSKQTLINLNESINPLPISDFLDKRKPNWRNK